VNDPKGSVDEVLEEARRSILALARAMGGAGFLGEIHPQSPCLYGCADPVTCVFPHAQCPHCRQVRARARQRYAGDEYNRGLADGYDGGYEDGKRRASE
jgi:hypothetical protein